MADKSNEYVTEIKLELAKAIDTAHWIIILQPMCGTIHFRLHKAVWDRKNDMESPT